MLKQELGIASFKSHKFSKSDEKIIKDCPKFLRSVGYLWFSADCQYCKQDYLFYFVLHVVLFL